MSSYLLQQITSVQKRSSSHGGQAPVSPAQHRLRQMEWKLYLWNTHSLRIQGNPASEELGCLGTEHVKTIYPSQKRLQQTWQESHENLILQGQDSANIKMGNCCTCKTNRWKLAFLINCGKRKKSSLRRLRVHCTWASTILPSKTS